jgi:hypothetical protein
MMMSYWTEKSLATEGFTHDDYIVIITLLR